MTVCAAVSVDYDLDKISCYYTCLGPEQNALLKRRGLELKLFGASSAKAIGESAITFSHIAIQSRENHKDARGLFSAVQK
jgi:hypothetical protein